MWTYFQSVLQCNIYNIQHTLTLKIIIMKAPELIQQELAGYISELLSFESQIYIDHPPTEGELAVMSRGERPQRKDLYYNFKGSNETAIDAFLRDALQEYVALNIFKPVTQVDEFSLIIFNQILIKSGTFGLACTDLKSHKTIPNSELLYHYHVKNGIQTDITESLDPFYATISICFIQQYFPDSLSPMLLWRIEQACSRILTSEHYSIRDTYQMVKTIEASIVSILPKTMLLDLAFKAQSLAIDRFCLGASKAELHPVTATELLQSGSTTEAWHKFFQTDAQLDLPCHEHLLLNYALYSPESLTALFNQKDINVFDSILMGLSPHDEAYYDQNRSIMQWLAVSEKYNQITYPEFDLFEYLLSTIPAFLNRSLIEKNIDDIVIFFDKAFDYIQATLKNPENKDDLDGALNSVGQLEGLEYFYEGSLNNTLNFIFHAAQNAEGEWHLPNLSEYYKNLSSEDLFSVEHVGNYQRNENTEMNPYSNNPDDVGITVISATTGQD